MIPFLDDPANDNHIPLIDGRRLQASLDRLDQYLEDLRADLGQPRKAQD